MPAEITQSTEKTVTAKIDVISWLTRSLDVAKSARATETCEGLGRKVEFLKQPTTADAVTCG